MFERRRDDTFEVGTVSGDIQLDRVSNPKVSAKTVNGTVTMTGPLASRASTDSPNMTGDVVLRMPHDASFQLNAKVSEKHDIVSDFVEILDDTDASAPPPKPDPTAETPAPQATEAKGRKSPCPRTGPSMAPIVVGKAQGRGVPYTATRECRLRHRRRDHLRGLLRWHRPP